MEAFSWLRKRTFATVIRFIVSTSRFSTNQDETLQVPSRDPERTIAVHVYRPKSTQTRSPVLVNFHGGGFFLPQHLQGCDDEFCRKVCDEAGYTVLDVQYRLAPEDPYPAATEDAEDVVKWAMEQENLDSSRVSLSGFSAGGNLALGLCATDYVFETAVVFYPLTDFSIDPGTKKPPDASGKTNPLFPFICRNSDICYISPGMDLREPRLSPQYLAADRFPGTVVFVTCAWDPLAAEAEELAEKIRAAPETKVTVRRLEGVGHVWDKECKPGTWEEQQKIDAYDLAVKTLLSHT